MSKKVQKRVPKLRFPEFHQKDYVVLELSDIASVERGKFTARPRNSPKYYGGKIPFVQTGDITGSGGRINSYSQTLNEEGLKVSKLFPKGSILMTIAANIGDVAISEIDLACPDSIVVVQAKPEVSRDWLFYSLSLSKRILESFATQNAQKNINLQVIRPLEINLPQIAEQEKIASFLGAVDARLGQLRRKHELLQTYKRGVMQQLFSQQIRFKQDDGTPFPDWEKKSLGQLASKQTQKNDDQSITRVLTNSATQGVIDQQDYFEKDIANPDNLAGYYILQKGDYVYNPRISTSAPVGPIKKNKIGEGVMSPLYTVFRFENPENTFYEQYFQTSLWHRYMCSVANYGARHDRMNITQSDFFNLPLPYPQPEEQIKIVNFINNIDSKIEGIAHLISCMEQFKAGLLQKMFV